MSRVILRSIVLVATAAIAWPAPAFSQPASAGCGCCVPHDGTDGGSADPCCAMQRARPDLPAVVTPQVARPTLVIVATAPDLEPTHPGHPPLPVCATGSPPGRDRDTWLLNSVIRI